MNLGEIRTLFVQRSGRYDLVNLDNADMGANAVINAAQKFLDRRLNFNDDIARYFQTLDAGEYFVSFENNRTINEVWGASLTSRWLLTPVTVQEMMAFYASPEGSVTQGTPLYWAKVNLRSMPDKTALDALTGYGTEIAVDGSQRNTVGIIVMPPVAETTGIELWGKFYSPTLTLDEDTSYWTEQYPDLLITAAQYQLEVINRNSEGMRDWLLALDMELTTIEFDLVETESNMATKMEG